MTENAEIKGVIPNYYSFIIDKLNRIANYEIERNYPMALHTALNLAKYLPRKLKNQLQPDITEITEKLANIKVSEYNQNALRKAMDTQIYKISKEAEPKLIDKITTLLDQEHLLTQSYGIPTKSRSMKDFQMTVDEAQYNANH